MTTHFNPCAIIPVFNHQQALSDTASALLAIDLPIIFIDDGSDVECLEVQRSLAASSDKIQLYERHSNGGKGAAVKDGLKLAHKLGFSHALQLDADGQHNSSDVPTFLRAAKKQPHTMIAGQPRYDESVPKHRYYARYLTHVWVWINTLSLDIKDSMCGFRVYPLEQTINIIDRDTCGDRMDFDPEVIVRWHWRQWNIQQLETTVIYPVDGISHFLPRLDNWLIAKMHCRLFFGMLRRLPKLLKTKWQSPPADGPREQ